MKTLRGLLAAAVLALTCAAPAHSQDQGGEPPITNGSPSQKMDAGESNKQMEQYRHSSTVQALGRLLHVSAERAAMIFEDFNSGVLIFAIGYGLFKYLPGAFKTRREKIERDLADARSATEMANERLKAVEARLAALDKDIEAIRKHAAHDSEMDQKRIEESLEAERARIIRSAEQEIGAAQAAAQRELKRFAANLAVDRAISRVQLSAEDDQTLVRDFTGNLDSMLRSGDFARRGRN